MVRRDYGIPRRRTDLEFRSAPDTGFASWACGILGSLAGLAVWEEKIPDGINKNDLRDHARNLMIGAFERGCDGIPTLD